jgi:uncharacterized membrane protein
MRDRFLWAGCVLYAAVFTWLGVIKYEAHRNLIDFGIFSQTVTSAFGCFCNPLEGSHWAFHFSPVLYLAAVAVWFFHTPVTLIALAAIAAALCAPPVYALVRVRSELQTARMAALVVWLYPPLAGLAFGDFHENVLAPAAVLWTVYAFDRRKFFLAAICAALVLSIKEDQAIFLAWAALGAAITYRSDRSKCRFATLTLLAALCVAGLFFFVIQPHANANPAWQPARFYDWIGADWYMLVPAGLLARVGFLVLILAPLAFIPLRTRAVILAVPPLLEVLASKMSTTFTLGTHYAGAWIGYLLVGFAAGSAEVASRGRAFALLWALAFCALEFVVANPLHPGLNVRFRQIRDAALDASLATLPRGVSMATQEEAYTHLAFYDPFVRLMPESPDIETQACFILIDRDFPDSPRLAEYGAALVRLVAQRSYVLMHRSGGIEVYRRVGACR